MKKIRVAINGLGRIGRAFFRVASKREELDIVAVNDLGDVENLAYLLKHDTAQGTFGSVVEGVLGKRQSKLIVDKKKIPFFSIKDPAMLPWEKLGVDIVVEATGIFAGYEKSKPHLGAGARRVVITAPVKDEPPKGMVGATVLMGINAELLKTCDISSNASCTTNAGSPLMAILDAGIGVKKAILNTVHGYTATQALVDAPSKKDFRRGRAAAQNIIPSTTGAAIATTKALPSLEGKFDGIAMRVPIIAGSIVDVTFISGRDTSAKEVNDILEDAAHGKRWKKIFSVTKEPVVSSDIIGSQYASIADLSFTKVVGGNLVKVLAWYDNEMGYTHALVEHVIESGKHISN